jgi:hypothetical protein
MKITFDEAIDLMCKFYTVANMKKVSFDAAKEEITLKFEDGTLFSIYRMNNEEVDLENEYGILNFKEIIVQLLEPAHIDY